MKVDAGASSGIGLGGGTKCLGAVPLLPPPLGDAPDSMHKHVVLKSAKAYAASKLAQSSMQIVHAFVKSAKIHAML